MPNRRNTVACALAGLGALTLLSTGCAPDYRWCLIDGNCGGGDSRVAGSVFARNRDGTFSEVLIQSRTFTQGRVVSTTTYRPADMQRTPVLVDFNGDGKVDPVVAYNNDKSGVIQILLSYGPPGTVQFQSLTLDGGGNSWANLQDIAVGDIDGDGNLDIVAATRDGIVYLRHPSLSDRTHVLSEWGAATPELELLDNTTEMISEDELQVLIKQAIGPAADVNNYLVTVEQGYTSVAIGDFSNNGNNDIAASRRLRVSLEPRPDLNLEPVEIVAGSIQVLLNPGRAVDGRGWASIVVGQHERHNVLDREGARHLYAYDVDGDGDLDLVSTAVDDRNVQVAWFENPGRPGPIDVGLPWTQRRIGSVRGAFTIDVLDITGDGRVDVVATSPDQMQLVLFVQPESVLDRGYDWFTVPIVNFQNFEPRTVKGIDVDNDGQRELVVGGTNGALRYFKPGPTPLHEWTGYVIMDFQPAGDVGFLGYGDLDGDGDVDLVVVIDAPAANANRVSWVRNELISTP